MEDIEKLKKIAKLSQEMRKHGFATYHDEAVKAAEAVYKDTIATADTPEQRHAALQESKRSMATTNPDFEKQISQRLNDIEANLSSVIGKMNEMIKEINTLQQGGGSRAAPREAPREKETQKPLPAPEQKPAAQEPHARSGNYTPQDVQIDKIFYYGNKK